MHNVAALKEAQLNLDRSKAAVEYWQRAVRQGEARREEYWQQIKALGFHDIGHARGELAKPKPVEEDKHCLMCGGGI